MWLLSLSLLAILSSWMVPPLRNLQVSFHFRASTSPWRHPSASLWGILKPWTVLGLPWIGDCYECYANELFAAHIGRLKGLMFPKDRGSRNTPIEVLSFRRLPVISKEWKAKSRPQMEPYINHLPLTRLRECCGRGDWKTVSAGWVEAWFWGIHRHMVTSTNSTWDLAGLKVQHGTWMRSGKLWLLREKESLSE